MAITRLRSFISGSIFAAVATAATCYDALGNANLALDICVPTAKISACCGPPDYCLSNGLCFDAGANNLLGNIGCTDQNWSSPCHKYCPGNSFAGNLFPCSNTEQNFAISYCCGPNGSCCDTPSNIFSVPIGTVVLRPDQLSPSTSATSSTSMNPLSLTTAPSSATAYITSTSATQSATLNLSTSPSKSNSLALGLGLGLGIPLGMILIGAILFLAWELRKNNQRGPTSTIVYTEQERVGNKPVPGRKAELPA